MAHARRSARGGRLGRSGGDEVGDGAVGLVADAGEHGDTDRGDGPGQELAVHTDVPEFLWPVARFSVWAHLRKLDDEGTAKAIDRDDPDTRWTASA